MPELRSSTRQARLRSKKLDEPQPAEPAAKPVLPAPQRAGGRAPTRAARGRNGAAGRKVTPPKRKGAGEAVVCEAKNLALNKVAKGANGPRMDSESAENLVGVHDDVPERVHFLFQVSIFLCLGVSLAIFIPYFFDHFVAH
jgi:hypothetical protein